MTVTRHQHNSDDDSLNVEDLPAKDASLLLNVEDLSQHDA
jgi:hypothetical protein